MSDRRLQVFHTVAGVLSFTKAAELLNMTQPAVTHQIRQLEEETSTRLFDRANNRISLTEAGHDVLDYATRILELYEDMHEALKVRSGDHSGVVTLGASTTIAEYVLPGLLVQFRESFPDVQIRLKVANTEGIVGMVANNALDLGVVEGEVDNQLLVIEHWQQDELVVLMPPDHALVAGETVAASELLAHPFIQREAGSGTRSVLERYLEREGVDEDQLDQPFELGSTEAIKGAVLAGVGVAVVSRATVAREVALGLLATRPLAPPLMRPFYFVKQRQQFRSHLMNELFQFARQHAADA